MTLRRSRTIRSAVLAVCALTVACASSSAAPVSGRQPRTAASAPDSAGVYDIAVVEVKPRIMNPRTVARALEQSYPAELRDAGIGGTVELRFTIEADGHTSDVQVTKTTDFAFVSPARSVVQAMKFTPGSVGGTPVRVRATVPVTFQSSR